MPLLPIRKIVATALTAGVLYVLRHVAHVDIASESVQDAVNVFLPAVIGWAVKDPRVQAVEKQAAKLGLVAKLRLLDDMIHEAAVPTPAPAVAAPPAADPNAPTPAPAA